MKGVFIITIYLCINLIVAVDYDPIEESLQSMNNDQLVQEFDQDPYETVNVFPRSADNECLQNAVSDLKSTSEKLKSQIDELEQLINSEPAATEPPPPPESDGCDSEVSETPPNTTSKEVPVPMEAYGYANESTKGDECGEDGKLKTWDKQITVCKEILQNNNKNLIDMISDLYPEGHKRTIKIQTKYRKGKSSNGKRGGNAWTNWTNWSPCSVSCGAGKQIRYRKCTGANCSADIELDERQCFQPTCSSFHKMLNNFQSIFERP